MMDQRIADLEKKFEGVQQQISQIKKEFSEAVNHVEHVLQKDIDLTCKYAVCNEQYSRKNDI